MGLFGAIKRRVFGRSEEDFGDIRSTVLGEGLPPETPPPKRYEEIPPEADRFAPRGVERAPEPGVDTREPMDLGGPIFSPREEKEPIDVGTGPKDDYEVIDKLNFIENQLSAIKSQTETINERLKNLEMKIGRRY